MVDLEPILEQVASGDPIGAAYRLTQAAGQDAPGRLFYEAGSLALSRRDEVGEDALRFARLMFAEAVERDPQLGEAHHDLATTMRELGMAEDAIAVYRKALELLPDDVDCLIGLGAAQCDSGKIDAAITTLEHAVASHPESGRAQANLGVALEAAGRDEEAAGAYARAVARFDAELVEATEDERIAEVAGRRRWARIQHAELLERLERWPQAIVEFRRLQQEEEALDEQEDEAEEGEGEKEGGAAPEMLPEEEPGEDHEEEEGHAGRVGLERVFARLVQSRLYSLAYLVLDDLGGELADERTRATYAIYDSGDGLPTIMVEHWDGGKRERLQPV